MEEIFSSTPTRGSPQGKKTFILSQFLHLDRSCLRQYRLVAALQNAGFPRKRRLLERKNKEAWESIYITEGSGWFWWYSDEYSSENDEIFDLLFRETLSNVYRFLKYDPPEILIIPIIIEDREARPIREQMNFIKSIIARRETNYFEWIGSIFFLKSKSIG